MRFRRSKASSQRGSESESARPPGPDGEVEAAIWAWLWHITYAHCLPSRSHLSAARMPENAIASQSCLYAALGSTGTTYRTRLGPLHSMIYSFRVGNRMFGTFCNLNDSVVDFYFVLERFQAMYHAILISVYNRLFLSYPAGQAKNVICRTVDRYHSTPSAYSQPGEKLGKITS